MLRAVAVSALALCACGTSRAVDPAATAALLDRVILDAGGANGLSGLAVDDTGGLLIVAERDPALLRVELDGTRVRALTRVAIERDDHDLEALAWTGDGRLWVGLEGGSGGGVRVQGYQRRGDRFVRDAAIELTSAQIGVTVRHNPGVEGLCAAGGWLYAAVETVGTDPAGRWAPVVAIDPATRAVVRHQLRLTSATGKIAGLDCWREGDRVRAIAIERHFEVTRVLGFDLPAAAGAITPTVLLDLGPALRGALNLEGVVRLPDGRVVAVVDNQYGRITGPNELVVLRPDRLALPPAR